MDVEGEQFTVREDLGGEVVATGVFGPPQERTIILGDECFWSGETEVPDLPVYSSQVGTGEERQLTRQELEEDNWVAIMLVDNL